MINEVKDHLTPKTFSILAYVCLIVHCLCGAVFTGIVIALKEGEREKFTCNVSPQSTATYKTQIDKACFSRYQHDYNSPLPFYGFVILSIWFPIIVAVIYSLCVRRRVEEVDSNTNEPPTQSGISEAKGENKRTLYVLYFYASHVAIHILCGILFTILQYAVFYPSGFDFEFSCSLPSTWFTPTNMANNISDHLLNRSPIICENSAASEKQLWCIIVSILNTGSALVMLGELIRLRRQFRKRCWRCDTEFVMNYLLKKQYLHVEVEMTSLSKCIDFYQQHVLETSRTPDVIYGPKTSFEQLYINLVIHTERAKHEFSENMERDEMLKKYTEVSPDSIRLEEVKDLFYPNKDTNNKHPHKIFVVGRPGIGKTVLTEKVIRDWAREVDQCFRGKIAFHFRVRWFNLKQFKDISFKTFLRYGTGLSDEKFESIYEHITKQPKKAIIIFDGLDEFNGNMKDFDDILPLNDPNVLMPAIELFINLLSGHLLQGAIILVTSRPIANEIYSKYNFDRIVEIIGFTPDEIEEYVSRFCENNNRNDLKTNVWNYIQSSSNLLNLCYIPVTCFIACTVVLGCFSDGRNETRALPTTLTELYHLAIVHFDKHHCKQLDRQSTEVAIKKLELLAFDGIENTQLVFNNELFDEKMKKSGLLNSLSNPIFPVDTQFCFIHLTIQEFLAARHVVETFSPEKIKDFIVSSIESGKWHLVVQFVAGLLGKKITNKNRNDLENRSNYNDCVLAFTHRVIINDGEAVDKNYHDLLFAMEWVREVNNESLVREACEKTVLNDIHTFDNWGQYYFTLSNWAAVTFVGKHMQKLDNLRLDMSAHFGKEIYLLACNFLQQRCVKNLILKGSKSSEEAKCLFKALMKSQCTLTHEHSIITNLKLLEFHITNECLLIMHDFFESSQACCLKQLSLVNCGITTREISKLCEVLDVMVYPEFTHLALSHNMIFDEGVKTLFNALKRNHLKLTDLLLDNCSLSDNCVPSLCELLKVERCNLTVLSLNCNKGISDEGLGMLCESALTEERCKLAELELRRCSLTDKCIPELHKALQHEHCRLNKVDLTSNEFTKDGKKSLHEVEKHELCQARGLKLDLDLGN